MELLFESRPEIVRVDGQLYFFQARPRVHPEAVLVGNTPVDARGATFYGSVLRDGGRYRMWYQAWPEDWAEDHGDSALVAYAESDDGFSWRKPVLNRVEYKGSKRNNLVNLGVHGPSVFVDPTAPPGRRYRATGCIDSRYRCHHPVPDPPFEGGYFTLHSADGFHWETDAPTSRWPWADNAFSVWHPGRERGEALLKRMPRVGGMARRAWWGATLERGVWSDWKPALVPDDYDDVIARRSGHVSADYYGVAMMPAGRATVGFVTQFRHRHPLVPNRLHGGVLGNWGETDVTLAYQPEEGAPWLHAPGRPDFLTHGEVPWARDGWYLGSGVADCGDEQRLYATGSLGGHMAPRPGERAMGSIGFAAWPTGRLFGFCARPAGEIEIELGFLARPSELILNFKTESRGSVRAQILSAKPLYTLEEVEGHGAGDAVALTGDKLREAVRWRSGSVIAPRPGRRAVVRLLVEHASVFAYEVRPAD